jgi:alpha-beta hydrolase superfamily lysophospholipase
MNTTTATGKQVRHNFFRQTNTPQGLMIILPGRGYLLEHPALHYLAKMAMELGYDVLGIRYSFQMNVYETSPEVDYDVLAREVELAADEVLKERQYTKVVIAGKSLGTPLAVRLGERFNKVDLRYILFTPIMNVTELVRERPTLAVIGTADAAYDAELVRADEEKPYMQWHVLDGVNHGLEFEYGWDSTIGVLGRVIGQCEAFLRHK